VVSANAIETLRVFDVQGRTVYTSTNAGNEHTFTTASGMFLVEITTAAGRAVERVVVR